MLWRMPVYSPRRPQAVLTLRVIQECYDHGRSAAPTWQPAEPLTPVRLLLVVSTLLQTAFVYSVRKRAQQSLLLIMNSATAG